MMRQTLGRRILFALASLGLALPLLALGQQPARAEAAAGSEPKIRRNGRATFAAGRNQVPNKQSG